LYMNKKKVVILQSNYIPWKGYFDLINDADEFIFYDEVKYTKNDWRNRNKIKTPQGDQWLTVPIHKDAVKQKISEVKIDSSEWQSLHHKTLLYNYKRAPFFHQLEPFLNEVYLNHQWRSLSELNCFSIKYIAKLLNIKTMFTDVKQYNLEGERVNRLINIIKQAQASIYISGPSAKNYLAEHEHLFEDNGIELRYKNYFDYPEYKQMHTPFSHAVSVLDMIANLPLAEINNYIWKHRTQL
jgi:WbqC-like protein family